jgi:L-alanine-DL-glutamate epimerase-like enolase superfamily enzyme
MMRPDWIEEPIRDESPEAYEELRKLSPVAFTKDTLCWFHAV